MTQKESTKIKGAVWSYSVPVEKWRMYSYFNFWLMIAFAITVTNIWGIPYLEEGDGGEGCGPFKRDGGVFGLTRGQGFDFKTQTHLQELFGYPNICTNWDYYPSRELTAMIYPLFELSLLVYLFLDYVATYLAYKRGEIDRWFFLLSKFIFYINFLLCTQFRMIFIIIAYENPKGHTAGFLGLQIAMVLLAIENTLFTIFTKRAYGYLKSVRVTKIVALIYLTCLCVIDFFKINATIHIVMHGVAPPWTLDQSNIGNLKVGQVVDYIWMVFNAVLPFFIALIRSRTDEPIKIAIFIDESHTNKEDVLLNPSMLEESAVTESTSSLYRRSSSKAV